MSNSVKNENASNLRMVRAKRREVEEGTQHIKPSTQKEPATSSQINVECLQAKCGCTKVMLGLNDILQHARRHNFTGKGNLRGYTSPMLVSELEALAGVAFLRMSCGCGPLRSYTVKEVVEHARKGDGVDYFFRVQASDFQRKGIGGHTSDDSLRLRSSAIGGVEDQPRHLDGAAEGETKKGGIENG